MWKGRVLALVILLSVIGAGAYVLTHIDLESSEAVRGDQITATMKRGIEKQLKLTFPTSTEYLLVLHEGFLDEIYDIKLRMPKSDAVNFLHHLPVGNFVPENPLQVGPNDPDWKPHQVRQFKAVSIDHYAGGYLRVLVDTGEPNSATVYVEWYTT